MTNINKLEDWYVKNYGEIKAPKRLTDIIPSGKTLFFGTSGIGKTYSLIKHLNRHNIKPLLLDFDNNCKVDGLDFSLIGGVEYIKASALHSRDNRILNAKHRLVDILFKDSTEMQMEYMPKREYLVSSAGHNALEERVYPKLTKEQIDKYEDLLYGDDESGNIFHLENETIIIDTVAKALFSFDDFIEFEKFINKLLKQNNNVIVVAHTKRHLNTEVADIDEVFANHCDCQLQLIANETITKKKTVYLNVKKLRGYKGETMIKDWER